MGARQPLVTDAEVIVAETLTRAKLVYNYEPRQFNFHLLTTHLDDEDETEIVIEMRGFRPDFYLPAHKLYIEVGTLRQKAKKLKMMRKHFPNVRVLVVDNTWGDWLRSLDAGDVLSSLHERWVEQEYLDGENARTRHTARQTALAGNYLGSDTFDERSAYVPSLRTR